MKKSIPDFHSPPPPSAECFPGGIHWLSIGQLDKPDLLVKIQSLCFRLEQSLDSQSLHRSPNTLDEAKERLRFLMLRRYPRSLSQGRLFRRILIHREGFLI